jgi:hypothetical protein
MIHQDNEGNSALRDNLNGTWYISALVQPHYLSQTSIVAIQAVFHCLLFPKQVFSQDFRVGRVLDEGGLVWENSDDDATLDEVLNALDAFFVEQMTRYG